MLRKLLRRLEPPPPRIKPAVQAVIDLLRNEPDQWTRTEHWLNHSGGLEIWIADGLRFLRITLHDKVILPPPDYPNITPSHRALWDAIQRLGDTGNHALTDYMIKAEAAAHKRYLARINQAFDNDIAQPEHRHAQASARPMQLKATTSPHPQGDR